MHPKTSAIDWARLTAEFLAYDVPAEMAGHNAHVFEEALLKPLPRFAQTLLDRRVAHFGSFSEAVRALYGFLLEKRYEERFNLLHFAFSIFDEESPLPEDIVARTPFPHEDGIPSYRHHGNADSVICMPEDQV